MFGHKMVHAAGRRDNLTKVLGILTQSLYDGADGFMM